MRPLKPIDTLFAALARSPKQVSRALPTRCHSPRWPAISAYHPRAFYWSLNLRWLLTGRLIVDRCRPRYTPPPHPMTQPRTRQRLRVRSRPPAYPFYASQPRSPDASQGLRFRLAANQGRPRISPAGSRRRISGGSLPFHLPELSWCNDHVRNEQRPKSADLRGQAK